MLQVQQFEKILDKNYRVLKERYLYECDSKKEDTFPDLKSRHNDVENSVENVKNPDKPRNLWVTTMLWENLRNNIF